MVKQNLFVEQVAQKIFDIGLATPAILLLEAHKPLAFLASQLLLIAQPTLNLFFSPPTTENYINLLAEEAQLEQLISRLEQHTLHK